MKKITICLLILSVVCALCLSFAGCSKGSIKYEKWDPSKYTEMFDYSGYTLFWSDEFEGTELKDCWIDKDGVRRQGYWSKDLAILDGEGHLIIRTEMREDGVYSGAIRTGRLDGDDEFTHGFGYYEIRCKLPSTTGLWHAFWMACGDVKSEKDGSADGVEIDVFEYLPARDAINVSLHWDGYNEAHQREYKRFSETGVADGEYHLFGMNWDEDGYTFYIDGRKVWTTQGAGICHAEGYLKISTEVDDEWAAWAGKFDPSLMPVDWVIDYVRIYDKNS